jgi:hypothetical protein
MDEEIKQKYKRLRNLPQYKRLSEDEFEEAMLKRENDNQPSADFERRIELRLKKFEADYDTSDMKINDLETLRALVQAQIALEDYEQAVYRLRQDLESVENVVKLNKIMTDLRSDISSFQNDLKITRKIRKSDQETSLINYIDSLKEKAKKFHEAKERYIFCPKCNLLLATTWFLYPDSKGNKMELVCKRKLADGTTCDTVVRVNAKDLTDNRGSNKPELMPEALL